MAVPRFSSAISSYSTPRYRTRPGDQDATWRPAWKQPEPSGIGLLGRAPEFGWSSRWDFGPLWCMATPADNNFPCPTVDPGATARPSDRAAAQVMEFSPGIYSFD
jgi:hypothetical protein